MNLESQAKIIINDLDSIVHRITDLQKHPCFTTAITNVLIAKDVMSAGLLDINYTRNLERCKQIYKGEIKNE